MFVRLVPLVFLIACGGRYGGTPRNGAGKSRGIEAAALPYAILDARTGRQVDTEAFWTQVNGSRVVCVGEEHDNPHHHWAQLEVMRQVATRHKTGRIALGMEMFQTPFQGVLDDYAAGRIDVDALLSRTGYADRWGYEFRFYRPTIDKARQAGAALLALNTPRELTKKVVRKGLEALSPDEQKQMPELVLDDPQHRAWFDAVMDDVGGGHGHGDNPHEMPPAPPAAPAPATPGASTPPDAPAGSPMPSAARIYAAQVLWDETMASGAAAWAKAQPTGVVVLLAGNGHCHDSAIVNRVKRRGVDRVISVQPVLDVEGRVAGALAKPFNDFLLVLELPSGGKSAPGKMR
jgi:uncharacterized iron-regulated protein